MIHSNCCTGIGATGLTECMPSMNEKMTLSLENLTGNTRKAMKLLAKQYRITSLETQDDFGFSDQRQRVTAARPLIVNYETFEYPHTEFQWTIEQYEIKYH